jgi:GNAT superfamily N-acetyltransferase
MPANAPEKPLAQMPLHRVATTPEARDVSAFLLRDGLFGTPLTPGERKEFSERPAETIGLPDDGYWFALDGDGDICGVVGVRANFERTGIFEVSAMAIRHDCRGKGLGRRMLDFALHEAAGRRARGMLFETSSDPSYQPMHHLLRATGFAPVGRFPDFYFPGEDTLWFFRPIPPQESAAPSRE